MVCSASFTQHKTENIVIVTLDGMRWEEVFKGVDSAIIVNKNIYQRFRANNKKFLER
jgi:hypothetical protein